MTMLFTMRLHVIAAVLCICVTVLPVSAQEDPQPVRTAAFERTQPRETEQTVRFAGRPARVGDEVQQELSMEVRLATSVRKGDELAEKNQSTIRNAQRRAITTTEVAADRASAVRVQYLDATKEVIGLSEPATAQAVAGKTYLCRREPGDDGKLVVTDEQGNIPSLEEFEIVASNMEMVGRANPLAQFLSGRSIKTGETVELPQEIANQVFSLGEQFGDVTRFDLTLEKVQQQDGATCAVFAAKVEASSSGSSQMRMQVEGPFVVQADTCRAVKVDLSGPIGMSETRGSYSTAYQVIGTGQLKVGIASTFRDAKR